MRRVVTWIGIWFAGALTALPISPAAQKSSDRDYVAFCLKHMSPAMRHEIEALRCVLYPSELDEVLALPRDEDRRQWIDSYWSLRDPIFTTPENELRLEHIRRVAFAESAFFIPRSPMWDGRGETFIRYGPPSYRQVIAPETDASQTISPGELWHYLDHDMVVLFEDVFSRGEYTAFSAKPRGTSPLRSHRIRDPIDAPIHYVPHPDIPVPTPSKALAAEYEAHAERVKNYYETLETTPCVFSYDLKTRQQPFVFSIDSFRGGEWIDRVDVNIEFETNLRARTTWDGRRKYAATAVFWDTRRNEVARRERSVEIPAYDGEPGTSRVRFIPVQMVFSLPPGFYHMAVTVEDRTSGKISSYRTDVTCEDFESKLAVSDILFATSIEPTEGPSPFSRGPWVVVPHPLRRYQRFESIPVYFEVYNLAVGDGGASSYAVEYQVVGRASEGQVGRSYRGKKGVPELSSSFRQSTYGSADVVHIALKSDNLRQGIFDLRVKITDEITRAETVREASFSVVE